MEELAPKKPEDEKTLDERLREIELVVVEMEGCLTDGTVITGPGGEESIVTQISDLLSIRAWVEAGNKFVVIGRSGFPAAAAWCQRAGLPFRKHIGDKAIALAKINLEYKLETRQTLFMGANLDDLKALVSAGLSAAPASSGSWVRGGAHLVTRAVGGGGAVAELLERIISSREAPELDGLD